MKLFEGHELFSVLSLLDFLYLIDQIFLFWLGLVFSAHLIACCVGMSLMVVFVMCRYFNARALCQLIPQFSNIASIVFSLDLVTIQKLLILLGHVIFREQHYFQYLIQIKIKLRNSLTKRFLNSIEILLKQFGNNRQVFVLEPDPVNCKILLPQNCHQLISIR